MGERKLRYSERKRLSEFGSLGDLAHDEVPAPFRNALHYLVYVPDGYARTNMIAALEQESQRHFGWAGKENSGTFIARASVEDLLDFVEILIETCTMATYESSSGGIYSAPVRVAVMSDVELQVNHLCERHRFGYRFEKGQARKIGSPLLEVEVVGPALLAMKRPGWEQVERSFREALDHQRGGETDDALTAAHAAVEAALKAVGMTGQFGSMTKQFRNSGLVPPYLQQVPEALDALMTLLGRSNAIRSADGDAHGKAPGAAEAPQALADLAIHWAGAFIVYLGEVAN